MRDSYFTSDVSAILEALYCSERQTNAQANEILDLIKTKLEALLGDERMPERQWRQAVAEPLRSLAKLMRAIGRPTPSVEALADEMAL